MSNFLAIATVTEALKRMLQEAINTSELGAVSGALVTAVRPTTASEGLTSRGINVFMFQVTPNVSLRNLDLPTRRANGDVAQTPVAALDLHYLLTFHGDDRTMESHRLMALAIRALHTKPQLTRAQLINLRDSLEDTHFLKTSDLAEQAALVKFTPTPLNLEELSKLWSVLFQTPYALSLVYQASVVLIESKDQPSEPLPVRHRVIHLGGIRLPRIDRMLVQAPGPGQLISPDQPLLVGSRLILLGKNFSGKHTMLRLGRDLIKPETVADEKITLFLDNSSIPLTSLRAGIQPLQVVLDSLMGEPPVSHYFQESSPVAITLRPTVRNWEFFEAVPPGHADPVRSVRVFLDPPVKSGQIKELILDEWPFPAPESRPPNSYYASGVQTADADAAEFPVPGVPAGTYLIRVRLDGAESLLEISRDESTGELTVPATTPMLTIPEA